MGIEMQEILEYIRVAFYFFVPLFKHMLLLDTSSLHVQGLIRSFNIIQPPSGDPAEANQIPLYVKWPALSSMVLLSWAKAILKLSATSPVLLMALLPRTRRRLVRQTSCSKAPKSNFYRKAPWSQAAFSTFNNQPLVLGKFSFRRLHPYDTLKGLSAPTGWLCSVD